MAKKLDAPADLFDSCRVCIFTTEPFHSAAWYVAELSVSLAASGMYVLCVVPANFQYMKQLADECRIAVHTLPARKTESRRTGPRKILDNLSYLKHSLGELFRLRHQYEILHIQFTFHYPLAALLFAPPLLWTKVAYTAHDPRPHKSLLPEPLRFIEDWSLMLAYHASSCIFVHNIEGKNLLTSRFSQNANKIKVIPHGRLALGDVPLPFPNSERVRLLVFGTIRSNKGVDIAIKAVQLINVCELRVELLIAGNPLPIEPDYWGRCRSLIKEQPRGITFRVEHIPDSDVPDLLRWCHCVLLPYTTFESQSGVALLALSNGRPLIATRVGGLDHLLSRADLGIAISDATPEDVAASIQAAMDGGVDFLARKATNGYQFIRQHCAWSDVARQTISGYNRIRITAYSENQRP